MPELYTLSLVALALPVPQVSVERSFSTLKFVLFPQRSNMNDKILDDIMVIRKKRNGLAKNRQTTTSTLSKAVK